MDTQLIEFDNPKEEKLRGIILDPQEQYQKGVVFVSGLERSGTTEPKFKDLSDRLHSKGVPSMRFDFSGLGLSDGKFRDTTPSKWAEEFAAAYEKFGSEKNLSSIYVVAHSVGASVLGKHLNKDPNSVEKAVLIAPGINQKDLTRYNFTKIKNQDSSSKINWNNYEEYLDESEFQKDIQETKTTKYNFLDPGYFQECSKLDLTNEFEKYKNKFLHIHGEKDTTVPIESIEVDFLNSIIVKGGDHDLEKPYQKQQWINGATEYLSK